MTRSREYADMLDSMAELCNPAVKYAPFSSTNTGFAGTSAHKTPQSILTRTIETEVIPRLMLAHRLPKMAKSAAKKGKVQSISAHDVDEFAKLTVNQDYTVAEAYVEALMARGASAEKVFSQLFAPAARRLGEWWEADSCTFSDVTIGLSRIHKLVHQLSGDFEAEGHKAASTYSALLAPMPGEHHGLGLLLVEEYFRRAGWSVWCPYNVTDEQLIAAVRQERFDMVGISVTCDASIDRLSALVASIRSASLNDRLVVMVGGRVFNDHPEFVAKVGADATDTDGSGAICTFEKLSGSWLGH